jgi:hypothetical protein
MANVLKMTMIVTLIFRASPSQPTIWFREDPGTTFTLSRPIVQLDRSGFESFCPVVAVRVRFWGVT